MSLDPNVQVALVTIFSTIITTAGVVTVAVINRQSNGPSLKSDLGDRSLDIDELFERTLSLLEENERKETALVKERRSNRLLRQENAELKKEIVRLTKILTEGGSKNG